MTDSSSRKGKSSFGWVFMILGILMGAAALISLIQRWTGVEIISEIARDALSLYRQMMGQFHWALFSWWTPIEMPWGWAFDMPTWGIDLLALYLFMVGSVYRAHYSMPAHNQWAIVDHWFPERRGWFWLPMAPVPFLFLIFAAVLDLLDIVGIYIRLPHDGRTVSPSIITRFMKTAWDIQFALLSPFVAVAAFFLWNAIQLTPQ